MKDCDVTNGHYQSQILAAAMEQQKKSQHHKPAAENCTALE